MILKIEAYQGLVIEVEFHDTNYFGFLVQLYIFYASSKCNWFRNLHWFLTKMQRILDRIFLIENQFWRKLMKKAEIFHFLKEIRMIVCDVVLSFFAIWMVLVKGEKDG